MTIQDKILKIIWREKEELSLDKLQSETEFSRIQIHTAIQSLENRRLIKVRRVPKKVGYKVFPGNDLYFSLNYSQMWRINRVLGI